MRPLRLDLAGFGAFRDEATVDFTDADFFALVGPTGSGKSTVLDAVCFALYGTVPRWRNTSSVANALAPSAVEARVRLAFETAGQRFVATRVVRRDGKGRVKTASAGLQRMPDGFDVRRLDTGLTPNDLGEVLAGTPSEMDVAVPEVIGLPYHQFVTCVVLPQGEFAEFLHAKPATRQQILVNLLGLSAYQRVRERAAGRATAAAAELAAADRLLADLAELDDAALAAAEQRVASMRGLAEQVAAALPELAAAQAEQDRAADALRTQDDQIGQLAAVRPPVAVAALAEAAATARDARGRAADAVGTAEEREEKLRGELAAAGDPNALRTLLAAHQERGKLASQLETVAGTVAAAQQDHDQAAGALGQARAGSQQAQADLAAAREAYGQAQTADQAAALRAHLVAGAPCPVCTQPVSTVPPVPADSAVAHAEAAGKQARTAADAAERAVAELDSRVRERDRALTAARTQAEVLGARRSELDTQLVGAPTPATLDRELAGIAGTEQRLAEAAAAVRTAREAHRRSQAEAGSAAERLTAAWREFESARDALAGFQPPPADRDDLAAAWSALAGWAASQASRLRAGRGEVVTAVAEAEAAVGAARDRLTELFRAAGLPAPSGEDAARAATVAAERARAELDALRARREQADQLRERRAGHERAGQVARALAQHLRANNFEAWLLEEALDRLVEGASVILRDLSAGQYDLVHDGRELFVVDHHDAGLRRPVRTLSGGEVFQASLALALALSDQLAGFSTASASLESILLDEGFGTLDASTLDAVAATLENLAARGDRMVGVVTHVPALAERIPVRYETSKDARSARVERVTE
ncbi:MAG: AAA family ATPase [Micromonosporaceae bacterium]|nr:AAA family ATPase [Micromonosporaceae bacterium]